jgi:hypothetical protein
MFSYRCKKLQEEVEFKIQQKTKSEKLVFKDALGKYSDLRIHIETLDQAKQLSKELPILFHHIRTKYKDDKIQRVLKDLQSNNEPQSLLKDLRADEKLQKLLEDFRNYDEVEILEEGLRTDGKLQELLQDLGNYDKLQKLVEELKTDEKLQELPTNLGTYDKLLIRLEDARSNDEVLKFLLDQPKDNKLQNLAEDIRKNEKLQNLLKYLQKKDILQKLLEDLRTDAELQILLEKVIIDDKLQKELKEQIQILRTNNYKSEMENFFNKRTQHTHYHTELFNLIREEIPEQLRKGKTIYRIKESYQCNIGALHTEMKKIPKVQQKQYFINHFFPTVKKTVPHWSDILKVTECDHCNYRYHFFLILRFKCKYY